MIDYRAAILDWAKSQVGPGDRAAYWVSALGHDPGTSKQWCGAFCLAALHAAGLALERKWGIDGSGIVGPLHLKPTRNPQRGDIGYLDKPYQHHFLFDYADPDGWCHSVDGNQAEPNTVQEKRHRMDHCLFYSIEPLIPLPEAGFLRGEKYSVPGVQDLPEEEK